MRIRFDPYEFGAGQPPSPSPKLAAWVARIKGGWKPNRRLRSLGYSERCEFYEVTVWEQLNVLDPLLDGPAADPAVVPGPPPPRG